MKNVVIHKIVKYIFTGDQLKSLWESHKNPLSYDSLSDEQIMTFAKKSLGNTSHTDLEHHKLGSNWRTEKDFEGKVLAEDDSDVSMHVELIDTSLSNDTDPIVRIDRLSLVKCTACGFEFFIEDPNHDLSKLKCPIDGETVDTFQKASRQIKKN